MIQLNVDCVIKQLFEFNVSDKRCEIMCELGSVVCVLPGSIFSYVYCLHKTQLAAYLSTEASN